MFGASFMFVPGQEFRSFDVFTSLPRKTKEGRVLNNSPFKIGSIKGILAFARSEERERWKQLSHTVTHKIISKNIADFEIKPGDFFQKDGRKFFVQGLPYNVGDISHFIIYYCEEKGIAD